MPSQASRQALGEPGRANRASTTATSSSSCVLAASHTGRGLANAAENAARTASRRPVVKVRFTVPAVLDWLARLRADALNVTVTKEVKGADGQWTAAPVAAQTEADLENAILTKARQLNLANAG